MPATAVLGVMLALLKAEAGVAAGGGARSRLCPKVTVVEAAALGVMLVLLKAEAGVAAGRAAPKDSVQG
jgi:hypothetical protein